MGGRDPWATVASNQPGGGEGNTVRTRTPQVRVFGSTLGAGVQSSDPPRRVVPACEGSQRISSSASVANGSDRQDSDDHGPRRSSAWCRPVLRTRDPVGEESWSPRRLLPTRADVSRDRTTPDSQARGNPAALRRGGGAGAAGRSGRGLLCLRATPPPKQDGLPARTSDACGRPGSPSASGAIPC